MRRCLLQPLKSTSRKVLLPLSIPADVEAVVNCVAPAGHSRYRQPCERAPGNRHPERDNRPGQNRRFI